MEAVYKFIGSLGSYLNLIRRTAEAESQVLVEPGNKTIMLDAYDKLFRECRNTYRFINQTFDEQVLEIHHCIQVEINKRISQDQIILRDQLFDLINPYIKWLQKMDESGGFSDSSVFGQPWSVLDDDGNIIESTLPLSIHFFAEDLSANINSMQLIIKDKFKFLDTDESPTGIVDCDNILKKYLLCLSGCWQGKEIMTPVEYERLLEYAAHTIENGSIPKKIKPISAGYSRLPKLFYRQTIYRLWNELKNTKGHEQKIWIDFTTSVFKDQYLKSKLGPKTFSRYTKNYDLDKENITYKANKTLTG